MGWVMGWGFEGRLFLFQTIVFVLFCLFVGWVFVGLFDGCFRSKQNHRFFVWGFGIFFCVLL